MCELKMAHHKKLFLERLDKYYRELVAIFDKCKDMPKNTTTMFDYMVRCKYLLEKQLERGCTTHNSAIAELIDLEEDF